MVAYHSGTVQRFGVGEHVNVLNVDFRDFISAREAADLMGVNVAYLQRLRQGKFLLPAGKVGNANVYRRRDIERYIEAHPHLGKSVATR